MILKGASIFSQIPGAISSTNFEKLVLKHGAERNTKGFKSWRQLVAMLFCHLAHAESLRKICHGLSCFNSKLVHLGIKCILQGKNPQTFLFLFILLYTLLPAKFSSTLLMLVDLSVQLGN